MKHYDNVRRHTIPLKILYEDNHLLVVNKEAGMLTQPSGTDEDSVEALAKAWLRKKYHKPGNIFLEAVHRIDRPVSGIVLFAKTSKALSRLQKEMRSGNAKKVYRAVVEGCPSPLKGSLEHTLIHRHHRAEIDPEGKLSRLSYEVLERHERTSLVEIVLETGRYHQIRIQMASIGCPVVGDTKYGAKIPYRKGAIALQHSMLCIPHPISKRAGPAMLRFSVE